VPHLSTPLDEVVNLNIVPSAVNSQDDVGDLTRSRKLNVKYTKFYLVKYGDPQTSCG